MPNKPGRNSGKRGSSGSLGLFFLKSSLLSVIASTMLSGLLGYIYCHVYSRVWDAMQPRKKVALLDTTVLLLKRQYPRITPFINLKFDDERQDLNLKHGSSTRSG